MPPNLYQQRYAQLSSEEKSIFSSTTLNLCLKRLLGKDSRKDFALEAKKTAYSLKLRMFFKRFSKMDEAGFHRFCTELVKANSRFTSEGEI